MSRHGMRHDRKVQPTVSAPVHRSAAVAALPPVRGLQGRLGNQATQRFAAGLQRKPTVSAPDHPLERQADQIADQVLRMPAQDVIQRACRECEEEQKAQLVQRRRV